ncbi:hypothetical protein [Fructobacillus tropaeoli]|uniref:hypothetical protein n=1 Tax=Fructobacillus tropaeoli TaxID=709323 RepID=UPI0011E4D564|nr:hypothetical protein [Fructobacillus tropaeoli]
MDSIPSSNNLTSYYGIVANPNNGSFNVGSKGSLKIGITNSDSNAGVPYYGPININSVGGTHVIMIKPTAAKSFQTTAGTNDTATGGAITAYTVPLHKVMELSSICITLTCHQGLRPIPELI